MLWCLDNLVDLKGVGEQLFWIHEQLVKVKSQVKFRSSNSTISFDVPSSNVCEPCRSLSPWSLRKDFEIYLQNDNVKIIQDLLLKQDFFQWQERLKWVKALIQNTCMIYFET